MTGMRTTGGRASRMRAWSLKWGPTHRGITMKAAVGGLLLGCMLLGVQGFQGDQRSEIAWWVVRRNVEKEALLRLGIAVHSMVMTLENWDERCKERESFRRRDRKVNSERGDEV